MRRYGYYSALLARLLARLPWPALMWLLAVTNRAVDARLHAEDR